MLTVEIDDARLRANAEAVRARCGVDVIAVVKADAYGLGAARVAHAVRDAVAGFYVLHPREAAGLFDLTGLPTLAAVPLDEDADDLRRHHIRPAVWTRAGLDRWRACAPALSVDTGMQRFACPPDELDTLLATHEFTEAFTHAVRPAQAHALRTTLVDRVPYLHAAGTALLDDPTCRLNAVRPGLALYDGAVRVTTRVHEAHATRGPAGYTGFAADRHGVILAGYRQGLRPGPCAVNGRPQRIVEVGMQTSYVTLAPDDRAGDRVVLLGENAKLADVAAAWRASPQNVLVGLTQHAAPS